MADKKKTLGQRINYPGSEPKAEEDSFGSWVGRAADSIYSALGAKGRAAPKPAPSPQAPGQSTIQEEKVRKFQKGFNK